MKSLENNDILIMRWDKKNLERLRDVINNVLPKMSHHDEENEGIYFNHEAILEIFQEQELTSVTLQWYNKERDSVEEFYFGDDEVIVYFEE